MYNTKKMNKIDYSVTRSSCISDYYFLTINSNLITLYSPILSKQKIFEKKNEECVLFTYSIAACFITTVFYRKK